MDCIDALEMPWKHGARLIAELRPRLMTTPAVAGDSAPITGRILGLLGRTP